MLNYNCHENDEKYYIKFKETLKTIWGDEEFSSYDDIKYIPKVLNLMNYKILACKCERTGSEGDIYIFYQDTKNNKFYYFESYYGSCSYCDVWFDASNSIQQFMRIFKDEDRRTVEFDTIEEVKEFCDKHVFCDFSERMIRTKILESIK